MFSVPDIRLADDSGGDILADQTTSLSPVHLQHEKRSKRSFLVGHVNIRSLVPSLDELGSII